VHRLPCRAAIALLAITLQACAGSVIPRAPEPARREALVILPGFGYSRGARNVFRAVQTQLAADAIDVYAPAYVERGGLGESRDKLREFLSDHHLAAYSKVHVFAFIAGAWTLNPLLDSIAMPNLATVVYDRSPMQERAPRIADDKLHFLTWLRYGRPVFDMARMPYPPLGAAGPRVGVLIETKPTGLLRKYAKTALSYGPLSFACNDFGQRFDDCAYVAMSHDELYTRFEDVLPEVLAFIRDGRFTANANRVAPTANPLKP